MRATAAWRNESGAARVRAEYAAGATLCSHEPYVRLLRMIGALVGHRTTADGDVLVIWHVGSFDSSAWLAGMTSAEWREVTLRVLEYGAWRADALSTATGSLVRVSFIIDYDGLALKHHDPRIVARILPVLRWPDAHYPEYLGVALLVNAPWMFARLWDLLSPALSYALQERINISARRTRRRGRRPRRRRRLAARVRRRARRDARRRPRRDGHRPPRLRRTGSALPGERRPRRVRAARVTWCDSH